MIIKGICLAIRKKESKKGKKERKKGRKLFTRPPNETHIIIISLEHFNKGHTSRVKTQFGSSA